MISSIINMEQNVKVSVCVPVYGVEKYIERCARSLFEQTMTEGIEFIFVNDCTKDKSIEILERVLAEYPHRKDQVKIIHHEKNGGLVAARKTGLRYAVGDYIIHCDSDDWVDLNMYEKLYNKAVETDADMVYCDFFRSYSPSNVQWIRHYGSCNKNNFLGELISGAAMGALWNKLIKRDIAQKNDYYCPDHIVMMEDLLRVSQMLMLCEKIAYINMPLYYYFQNSSSIVHNITPVQVQNMMAILDFFQKTFKGCVRREDIVPRKILTASYLLECSDLKECKAKFVQYTENITLREYIKNCKFLKRSLFVYVGSWNFSIGCSCFKVSKRFWAFLRAGANLRIRVEN